MPGAAAPILLIDAGNSRIKWALAVKGKLVSQASHFSHRDTGPQITVAELAWQALPQPAQVWISNVAGARVAKLLEDALEMHWPGVERHIIRAVARECGVRNRYRTPAMLGSDRWAGLIGARAAFPKEHLLIATFGTATTIELLSAQGDFDGGLIAPGWELMRRSLGEHTAQLPLVAPPCADAWALSSRTAPNSESANHSHEQPLIPRFARDTSSALIDGCRLAQAGLVERASRAAIERLQAPVRCVLGGGAIDLIASALTIPFTRHDDLVLSGLALIAASRTAKAAALKSSNELV